MTTFTCSCTTLYCNCREKFITNSTSNPSMTTITTESYVCGEKVTKDNTIEVIFNKIKTRQRKKDIRNAMKEKKKLNIKLN